MSTWFPSRRCPSLFKRHLLPKKRHCHRVDAPRQLMMRASPPPRCKAPRSSLCPNLPSKPLPRFKSLLYLFPRRRCPHLMYPRLPLLARLLKRVRLARNTLLSRRPRPRKSTRQPRVKLLKEVHARALSLLWRPELFPTGIHKPRPGELPRSRPRYPRRTLQHLVHHLRRPSNARISPPHKARLPRKQTNPLSQTHLMQQTRHLDPQKRHLHLLHLLHLPDPLCLRPPSQQPLNPQLPLKRESRLNPPLRHRLYRAQLPPLRPLRKRLHWLNRLLFPFRQQG